jgi:hypothetical protein
MRTRPGGLRRFDEEIDPLERTHSGSDDVSCRSREGTLVAPWKRLPEETPPVGPEISSRCPDGKRRRSREKLFADGFFRSGGLMTEDEVPRPAEPRKEDEGRKVEEKGSRRVVLALAVEARSRIYPRAKESLAAPSHGSAVSFRDSTRDSVRSQRDSFGDGSKPRTPSGKRHTPLRTFGESPVCKNLLFVDGALLPIVAGPELGFVLARSTPRAGQFICIKSVPRGMRALTTGFLLEIRSDDGDYRTVILPASTPDTFGIAEAHLVPGTTNHLTLHRLAGGASWGSSAPMQVYRASDLTANEPRQMTLETAAQSVLAFFSSIAARKRRLFWAPFEACFRSFQQGFGLVGRRG